VGPTVSDYGRDGEVREMDQSKPVEEKVPSKLSCCNAGPWKRLGKRKEKDGLEKIDSARLNRERYLGKLDKERGRDCD
jgi:hypothetical protein